MIDAVRKTKNGITPSRKAVWQVLEDAVKVIYDKETDTLSIILRPGKVKVAESDEPRPGLGWPDRESTDLRQQRRYVGGA